MLNWTHGHDQYYGRYNFLKGKTPWPKAYHNGKIIASILCDVSYNDRIAQSGDHPTLTIRIAEYEGYNVQWSTLGTAQTLTQAKEKIEEYFKEKYNGQN